MAIADYILLGIALIAFIIGCKKGLLKRITGFLAWVGSVTLTSILHQPVLEFLLDSNNSININSVLTNFNDKISTWFIEKSPIFAESLVGKNESIIKSALSEAGIPGFLHSHFIDGLNEAINSGVDYTLASYFANIVSAFICSIIVYLALFLLIFLVLRLIAHFIDKLRDVFAISLIDGVLGGLFSVLKFAFVVCLIFLILSMIGGTNADSNFYQFISSYLGFDTEGTGICEYIYFENPILKLISMISFDELIDKILGF